LEWIKFFGHQPILYQKKTLISVTGSNYQEFDLGGGTLVVGTYWNQEILINPRRKRNPEEKTDDHPTFQ
jgi:hypothetical protein